MTDLRMTDWGHVVPPVFDLHMPPVVDNLGLRGARGAPRVWACPQVLRARIEPQAG